MLCAVISLSTAGEQTGLAVAAPTPIIHLEASDYVADSETWTNRGSSGGSLATASGGMTKTTSGVSGVVFAGKESSNSDRVTGSIGNTSSLSRATIEMWVRLKDKGSAQNAYGSMLFSWADSPHYNVYHYEHGVGFNTISSEIYGMNGSTYVNEWKHLTFVMVKNGSETDQKMYVNGVLQAVTCNPVGNLSSSCSNANVTSRRLFNSNGNFILMDNGFSANTWNAKADVGMLRVYNSELSQQEVTAAFDETKVNGYVGVIPPEVSSVAVPATPSTSRNISYTYTFSEAITGLASSDFSYTGTATGCTITPAASMGTVIRVDVSCTSDGTLTLIMSANSVTDTGLATGPTTTHTASTITIETPIATTTAPTTTVAPTTTTVSVVSTTTVPPTTTTVPTNTVTTTTTAVNVTSSTERLPTPETTAPISQNQMPVIQNGGVTTLAPTVTTVPIKTATRARTNPTFTTTTTTTTTTPPTATTTVPALSKIVVPTIASGSAVLQVNGVPVTVQISRRNNQVEIASENFTVRLLILKRDGSVSPLSRTGSMAASAGDSVAAEFEGLKPGTVLEVRMYSEPMLLGRTLIPANGLVTGSYEIPESAPSGDHSFAVLAIGSDGAPISFFAPMQVADNSTGPGLVALLIAVPVLLAMGLGLFLPPVLRRRRT
jgi:hypothetical protein